MGFLTLTAVGWPCLSAQPTLLVASISDTKDSLVVLAVPSPHTVYLLSPVGEASKTDYVSPASARPAVAFAAVRVGPTYNPTIAQQTNACSRTLPTTAIP